MGADGHIAIYSVEKLNNRFKEENVKFFIDFCRTSTCYLQKLEDKYYLTRYWGDNLDSSDYIDALDYYDEKKDKFNEQDWSYDSYIVQSLRELEPDKFKLFMYMAKFLEAECRLTSWEIWT